MLASARQSRVAFVVTVLAAAGVAWLGSGCARTRTISVPPLVLTPMAAAPELDAAPSTPTDTIDAGRTSVPNVVQAGFVDVTLAGTRLSLGRCDSAMLALVKGRAIASGEVMEAGDTLIVTGEAAIDLKGNGLAVFARVCADVEEPSARSIQRVRGRKVPELSWAAGKMHAHLDVENGPHASLGRLEGSAPFAEHAHPGSWEILCTVEASGTFTQGGEPRRVGSRSVVVVPPDTKHAWQPDEGTSLVAIQLYAPPGPEQRFKKLGHAR